MRKRVPGVRLIGLIAPLVPWSKRDEWLAEWRAELTHSWERSHVRGTPGWPAAFALRLRCVGALPDAWVMRRHNGGVSMWRSDVRQALRGVRTRPGFAAVLVLTIALGIGGVTAIFSVLDPVLVRPLPYPEAQRLAEVWGRSRSGDVFPGLDTVATAAITAALPRSVFEQVETGGDVNVVVSGGAEPEEVRAYVSTAGALRLLGARALLGRLYTEADATPASGEVVVLGEAFWRRSFGGAPDVLGRTLRVNDRPYTVIGVLPESFKYPLGTVSIWLPLRPGDAALQVRGRTPLVRLRAGVPVEAAQAHLDGVLARLEAERPRPQGWRAAVRPLENRVGTNFESSLRLLFAAVLCVLLIACLNAAGLLLVRGTGRRQELAVRTALGATRGRLVRQLVTESVVISLIGGALGVLLAYWGVRAMTGVMPESLTRYTQVTVGVDERVLAFAVIATLLTGLVFGAGPALLTSRVRLTGTSDRTTTQSSTVRHAGSALVVLELALSLMLLVGAGLLTRSFARLNAVDPGFEANGLVTLKLSLARHRYAAAGAADVFYETLLERLRSLPGVQGVALADGMPGRGGGLMFGYKIEVEGGGERPLQNFVLSTTSVSANYFDVLGIPIVDGRAFNAEDVPGAPLSVIIDPDFAAFLWPGQNAVGRRFRLGADHDWWTVVGVSGDVKFLGPDDRTSPFELYFAASQAPPGPYRDIAVRSAVNAPGVIPVIREIVREMDPDQPIESIAPASVTYLDRLAQPRFVLVLMSIFTSVAVVLAAVGVYGVISYVVAQRTREIGVRIALGATSRTVLRSVLREGMLLAGLGTALGLLGALALSRFITSQLFGVQPTDPPTLLAVALLLALIACLSALVPALRASRVSPLQALRVE